MCFVVWGGLVLTFVIVSQCERINTLSINQQQKEELLTITHTR